MSETLPVYIADAKKIEVAHQKYEPLYKLQAWLGQMEQGFYPKIHKFAEGLYAGSMFLPAGHSVVSQIHRGESFLICRYGDFEITNGDGEPIRMGPGDMLKTTAGTKRALFMFDDTMLTSIHPNPDNITDEDQLWELYVVPEI